MTTTRPTLTVHGLDWYDDGLGGLTAYRGPHIVGVAFPKVVGQRDGKWFGRSRGQAARLCSGRDEALRWVAGGCEQS